MPKFKDLNKPEHEEKLKKLKKRSQEPEFRNSLLLTLTLSSQGRGNSFGLSFVFYWTLDLHLSFAPTLHHSNPKPLPHNFDG